MSLPSKPKIVAKALRNGTLLRPTLAIQLGSGFKHLAEKVKIDVEIPYSKLSGFPQIGVDGHEGRLLIGRLNKVPVVLLCGRAHYYEGHAMREITFPIRVLARFGIEAILLTNAAGAVNSHFKPGEFMHLTDHINFMGVNPLRGVTSKGSPAFLDLSQAYDPTLTEILQKSAKKVNVKLHGGVYLAVAGPTYETPAEIRAFRLMGADACGMSTVPEAITARQNKMRVAAVSCITNAAGKKLSHEEVLAVGEKSSDGAIKLVQNFVRLYDKHMTDPLAPIGD